MNYPFGKGMFIKRYPLSKLLCLLSVVLLLGRCTCMPESSTDGDPVAKKDNPSTMPQKGMIENKLPDNLPADSNMRVSSVAFSFFYIDASEVESRRIVQTWLKSEIEEQGLAEGEYLAFLSNHDQPRVATNSRSLRLIHQALSQNYAPIPKPSEEADRIQYYLKPDSISWERGELNLHVFLSPSFHDFSKKIFLQQVLDPFTPHLMKTRLLIYTEQAVPTEARFTHSGLRSISYIQLTNANTL